MKRSIIALVLVTLVSAWLTAETSDYYPLRVDVVKVFAHADGYRVLYRRGASEVADIYLPLALFKNTENAGKLEIARAQLVRGDDPSLPYMTIFYKEGKFDHLRLYVRRDMRDPSWGVLAPSEGVDKFGPEKMQVSIKF